MPYLGPPAIERRESNRSRHEVRLGLRVFELPLTPAQRVIKQPPDGHGSDHLQTENHPEGSGVQWVRFPRIVFAPLFLTTTPPETFHACICVVSTLSCDFITIIHSLHYEPP